jgi:hypothetical protein
MTTIAKEYVYLTNVEQSCLGVIDHDDKPHINLKYYQPDYECFSEWTVEELKAWSDLTRKLKALTWPQIYRSGGKVGGKTGLGYTIHATRATLPKHSELDLLGRDITFFELRVTHKARVHGFRVKSAFFLVWLDRNHRIYPA